MRINASDVAAAAGFNRYKSADEMVEKYAAKLQGRLKQHSLQELYGKLAPEKIGDFCSQAGVSFDPKRCLESAHAAVQKLARSSIEAETPSGSIAAEKKVVQTLLDPTTSVLLDHDEATALQRALNKEINVKRGIRQEKTKTDKLERQTGKAIRHRNSKLYNLEYPRFSIVGRVDGIRTEEDGSKTLIETKVRRKRLFTFIPVYEKIQMEVYMRMIGANRAELNQNFGEEMNIMPYERETPERLWPKVLNELESFVDKVECRVAEANVS